MRRVAVKSAEEEDHRVTDLINRDGVCRAATEFAPCFGPVCLLLKKRHDEEELNLDNAVIYEGLDEDANRIVVNYHDEK